MSILDVNPVAVNLSALTQMVISGEMAASTAAGAEALTGTTPMAPATDPAEFAAALNAAGVAYLGAAGEHVGQRSAYAGAQDLASISYVVNEALSAAALTIS
jgi:hypothetical protein